MNALLLNINILSLYYQLYKEIINSNYYKGMHDVLLISIIVPVYNAEQYISKCIESILAQTYTHFELLLIDDGSKDNSLAICNNYAKYDNRIKVFTHANRGVSATRNRGLELAKGEYLSFVDSDDWVKPNYLQVLYDALQPNLGHGLVIASLVRCYATEVVPVEIPTILLKQNEISRLVTDFLEERITYSCSKLLNRKIIMENNLRFITNLSCFEDLFFTLDYVLHADYVNIFNEKVYCYHTNNTESLSSRLYTYSHNILAFRTLLRRLYHYQKKYIIPENDLLQASGVVTGFFHKVLISIFKNNYTHSERIKYLKDIIIYDYLSVVYLYKPGYFVDKIGKYLLCKKMLIIFDLWMSFLLNIRFPKMYGAKVK